MHRKMMDILRTYMIVGGMPQAVLSWITNHDFIEVDSIKRTILALYRNDIAAKGKSHNGFPNGRAFQDAVHNAMKEAMNDIAISED